MTQSDPGGSKGNGKGAARGASEGEGSIRALPAAAQRTLDEIADALGVTAALLGPGVALDSRHDAEGARLVEAAALLQAFVRIPDPALRRRCIAFVQEAAEQGRDRA